MLINEIIGFVELSYPIEADGRLDWEGKATVCPDSNSVLESTLEVNLCLKDPEY